MKDHLSLLDEPKNGAQYGGCAKPCPECLEEQLIVSAHLSGGHPIHFNKSVGSEFPLETGRLACRNFPPKAKPSRRTISARTDTPQNDLVESRFTETTTCPGNNEDNDDEAAVVPERSAQATTRLVAADVRLHRRPPVIAGGLCQAMRPRSVMSRRCRSRCVGSVPDGHLTAEFISDVTR